MMVRNQFPLWIASLSGFFIGLIQAMERLTYRDALQLGELGLAIALAVGSAMAIGARGTWSERILVALLRAGLSGGVFAFIFEGVRLFAKLGEVPLAVASWVFAGLLALLLARLRPAAAGPDAPVGSADHVRSSPDPNTGARPDSEASVPILVRVSRPGMRGAEGTPRHVKRCGHQPEEIISTRRRPSGEQSRAGVSDASRFRALSGKSTAGGDL